MGLICSQQLCFPPMQEKGGVGDAEGGKQEGAAAKPPWHIWAKFGPKRRHLKRYVFIEVWSCVIGWRWGFSSPRNQRRERWRKKSPPIQNHSLPKIQLKKDLMTFTDGLWCQHYVWQIPYHSDVSSSVSSPPSQPKKIMLVAKLYLVFLCKVTLMPLMILKKKGIEEKE